MGLGGWMLQEGYMLHLSNLGQQYKIKEKIIDVVGKEKANYFYDHWLLNHTSKQDIDSLATWGFNSVRLPMHYNLYTLPVEEEPVIGQQTWIEKGFTLTDSLLSWCKANKLYLILDLHAAPGGQGNDLPISDRDPSKPSLWESDANKQKTIALWRKLAERYVDEPWIGGYDLLNEPNWGFEDPKNDFRGIEENKNEPLKQLMVDISKSIREVDKKHIINSNTWFTEAISLAEKNNIGWAWWQQKKMGINNPLEIKRPVGYEKLLNYWASKGEKPSVDEAWKILQELLENIKDENNNFHPDVVDATIRQVRTTSTKPFKHHIIKGNSEIKAVDFDMGRQGYAYYDKDSARYQYTPGVNTEGNKGYAYRNDGVDVQKKDGSPYIFSIEDGEWMQYTIDVQEAGKYNVSFVAASEKEGSFISININDELNIANIPIAATGGTNKWGLSKKENIRLKKGINHLKVIAVNGGFNLMSIQFDKLK